MRLATKTLNAIETQLEADQGARFRGLLRKYMEQAGDPFDDSEEAFRSHLGASLIGRECSREIWYSFRWASKKQFSGRMLRLFNRGHLEEPRFLALLEMIGCQIHSQNEDGTQFRMKGYKGHYSGSLDGVGINIPDLDPEIPALLEFKTHKDSSFKKLKEEGVLKSKWEHFVQMQQYMGFYGLNWGLYGATNKDTDELHFELVAKDPAIEQRYGSRAELIIDSKTPPPKISTNQTFFKCKMCDMVSICHKGTQMLVNCRTCVHLEPIFGGQWYCSKQASNRSKEEQGKPCDDYLAIKNV
jgi:hypothetical protein